VEQKDIERIARKVLRELGVGDADLVLEREIDPDRWRLTVQDSRHPSVTIRCGRGTTAAFVRNQIFEQFQRK
jgi:hypothetical protein